MVSKNIAIACQGGGSHAAYAAGVLQELLPALESDKDKLKLVGISGTSGGAICALLAWYGMLEGGPAIASRKLQNFWDGNSASWPGEQIVNAMSLWGLQAVPFEFQLSPYDFPLTRVTMFGNQLWPLCAKTMGSANQWMRGDYFQLDKLVSTHVDFKLVEAIGKFCSISRDIKRWLEADLQGAMFERIRSNEAGSEETKRWLENRIRANLEMPSVIETLMEANGFPGSAPLRKAFSHWEKTPLLFDPLSLSHLSDRLVEVADEIPQLLIGAVDVGTGEFTAFSSERASGDGGISVNSILASAAIPWIFQAVPIEEERPQAERLKHNYWDGLFSQNPPIKNFVAGLVNEDRKPDEIWVAQINPSAYGGKDLSSDIWDRRNELSGNLSLNQEISFIDAINKRIELDAGSRDRNQRYVQVHRITMDSEAVERKARMTLGLASKLDRSHDLKDALMSHGRDQARAFLPVRTFIEEAFNERQRARQATLSNVLATAYVQLYEPIDVVAGGATAPVRLFVDDMTIRSAPGKDDGAAQVTTAWHTRVTTADGSRQVTLQGRIDFEVRDRVITSGQFRDVRVADSKPLKKPTIAAEAKVNTKRSRPRTPASKQHRIRP